VDYAEDQILGADVLRNGFRKVYDPVATVYHSHSLPPLSYLRRRYDEYHALRRAGDLSKGFSPLRSLSGVGKRWRRSARWVRRASDYTLHEKLAWTFGVGLYAWLDESALALARLPQPSWVRSVLSLQQSTRK
jgi:rhamnosyltransferase